MRAQPPAGTRSPIAGDAVAALVLLGCGAALVLHFGRLGFMPLDQSIVFDGAWRILSGQVPYRDFSTPSGVTPIVMQAPLFALLGPTWLAYCLHAAIVNGVFCVTVFLVLRTFATPLLPAVAYALASGVLLYPPIGTPYLEQHAFFFLLLALLLLLRACTAVSPGRTLALAALVPPTLVAAFLAKQNVVLFGSLPLLAVALLAPRDLAQARRVVVGGAAGLLASLGALVALGLALGVDPAMAANGLLWLPIDTGVAREVRVDRMARSLAFLLSSQVAVVAGIALLAVVAARYARQRVLGRGGGLHRTPLLALVLALALLATCLLFLANTKNHPANGCPYFFLALGLTHQAARTLLPTRLRLVGEAGLGAICMLALGLDVWSFTARVNAPRMVNDLVFRPALAARPATRELSFLRLQTPRRSGVTAPDLDRLVAFLRERGEDFFLLGDSSILYALSGRPSLSPSLWFHPGLTFPAPGAPGFAEWDAEIGRRILAGNVRWVVLEGPETWMRVRLDQIPSLARAVREIGKVRTRFGPFTVIELRR